MALLSWCASYSPMAGLFACPYARPAPVTQRRDFGSPHGSRVKKRFDSLRHPVASCAQITLRWPHQSLETRARAPRHTLLDRTVQTLDLKAAAALRLARSTCIARTSPASSHLSDPFASRVHHARPRRGAARPPVPSRIGRSRLPYFRVQAIERSPLAPARRCRPDRKMRRGSLFLLQ